MCYVLPDRVDFPENDRAAASDPQDQRNVQSKARWNAPEGAVCAPVQAQVF